MKPRLQEKLQAKKMVNAIYQPMGLLMSHTSGDYMWDWAKQRVDEQLELLISEIDMYQGNINPNWQYWVKVREELKQLP
jgi:hypothetical protein